LRSAASLRLGKSAARKRETLKEKSARAQMLAARLERAYGEVVCPLRHRNVYELLIAVMLSAQCTDAAVNQVTPALFARYPTPWEMAQASLSDIESCIHRLGLFRAKARSLKRCAEQLLKEFHGQVPSTMEDLTRLAGVGRKTANVIRGHAYHFPGIAVDTHCKRLSRRLGLTRQQDPNKIESDLARLLPPKEWTGFSHRLILHGRRVCRSRKPACAACALADLCPSKIIGAPSKPGRVDAS
jgi:endonuclease-3